MGTTTTMVDKILFHTKSWELFVAWIIASISFVTSFFISPQSITGLLNILYTLAFLASCFTIFGFVARSIKSLETQDRATINDYFWDVFLLMFFPFLGVWFLQPRLNLLGDKFYR